MDRPELEEFLSALNGFLDKPSTPQNSGYARFLEIFCRSVGANEGHLLQPLAAGVLQSVLSFGVTPTFDQDFNKARQQNKGSLPIDEAYLSQHVVAVSELKAEDGVPKWFLDVLRRYGFMSLVAVPLLGHQKTLGVLCAYYKDICLFDQGTLDRLMAIGKVVGTATEKSQELGEATSHRASDDISDQFLKSLIREPHNKIQIYGILAEGLSKSIQTKALLCGPLQSDGERGFITLADGRGVPSAVISRRYNLPHWMLDRIHSEKKETFQSIVAKQDLGDLGVFCQSPQVSFLCAPLRWKGEVHSAVIAWREDTRGFKPDEEFMISRLTGIAAIALKAS